MISNKYFIEVNGFRIEVFPNNSFNYKYNREKDQIFLRREIDGSIKFKGDDYNAILAIENSSMRCDEIGFIDQKLCNNRYVDHFNGFFSLNNASFNLDRCEVIINVETKDGRDCVIDGGDIEYNILEIQNEVTTIARQEDNYEYVLCRNNSDLCNGETTSQGWSVYYDNGLTSPNHVKIWYREIITTPCVAGSPQSPGSGWTLYQDNCSVNSTSDWVKNPASFPSTTVLEGTCSGDTPIPPSTTKNKTITPTVIFNTSVVGKNGFKMSISERVKTAFNIEDPRAGSTYTWSVIANGAAIGNVISGQGTSQVTIDWDISNNSDFNLYFPSVRVVETSSCLLGGSFNHTKILRAYGGGVSSTSLVMNPVTLINEGEFYKGETVRFTGNYPSNNTSIPYNGSQHTIIGGTVVSSGYDDFRRPYIDVKHDTTSPTVSIDKNTIPIINDFFYGDAGSLGPGSLANNTANEVIVPQTPDIFGECNICSDGVLNRFYVNNFHLSGTYNWNVPSGVSIVSGQGTNEIFVDWNGQPSGDITVTQTLAVVPQYQYLGGCDSGSNSFWTVLSGGIVYDRNRSLEDVINFIITDKCEGISSVVSDFYQINPENPSDINYVTGKTSTTKFITIGQKSDIKNPLSSEKATIGLMSRDELLESLRVKQNVFWDVDVDGVMRIEHYSYFKDIQNTTDLSTLYPECLVNRNSYSYDRSGLKRVESFDFEEANYIDFIGFNIDYSNADGSTNFCLEDGVQENELPRITTDLAYIQNSPSLIDDDGFVFLANGFDGSTLYVLREEGAFSGTIRNNMSLSWANLHRDYYQHNRNFITGFINNEFTTFKSAKRIKKQEQLHIPFCCDDNFDLQGLFKASFGEGEIDTAEINNKNKILTIELIY